MSSTPMLGRPRFAGETVLGRGGEARERVVRRGSIRAAMVRASALGLVSLVVGAALGCGGDAQLTDPSDGGGDTGASCTPRLPAAWVPQWRPPRVVLPFACSEDQIQREYMACESQSATSSSCSLFRNDPSNATCIGCLFSAEDEPSYGAIIRVGSSWKSNTAGCIALVDGDLSASGCGARVQAASACYDAACTGCQPFTAYAECREDATRATCRSYYLDAICLLRPAYSICTAYATNQDYFMAAARLFCGVVKSPTLSGGRDDALGAGR